jgi:NADH:ubiquinone oxidoreductase subunit 4 (subunit M)
MNAAIVPERRRANRVELTIALVVDLIVCLALLDTVRRLLMGRLWAGELNVWVGGLGAAMIVYLLWLRGRILPSVGYYLLHLKRVHHAEYQEYANSEAEVFRNYELDHTSVLRAAILALGVAVLATWGWATFAS